MLSYHPTEALLSIEYFEPAAVVAAAAAAAGASK
jgi:hypothetical protein